MNSPLSHMEHRWGERVVVDIPIYLAVHNRSGIAGKIKNLSMSGALIHVPIELKIDCLIRVNVHLPPRPAYATVLPAQVIQIYNGDAGIEWCEFAPHLVKEMLRAVPNRRIVR